MIQLRIEHEIARRQADEGMGRALDRAERDVPKWGDIAFARIVAYAKQHESFCGWMVVKAAAMDPNFPHPENEKAWGAPMQRAAREKVIERAGTVKDPNRHGNPIPLWRSLVYRGAA